MLEVLLLGAFAVLADGEAVALGGGRRADLLALLALAGGRPVHRARLRDDLWAGEAPVTAASKVQAHVSALRKALGPGAVRTTPHGYALGAGVRVDAAEWRTGVRQGLQLADQGDDLGAMAALSLAAERWPGEPLAGLGDAPFVQAERRALEALHLEGAERRAELRLRHGFFAATVADLGELVERYPLHEGLLAQLVLGTAMTGRQVEALMLLDRARERLVDEFGLEPGPKLRDAQERVLRGRLPIRSTSPARPTARTGLPELPDRLVGRAAELAALDRLLADPGVRLITLTGLGGVGKTRLAQAVVERRADSACWSSAADVAEPGDLVRAVAEQLGVATGQGDALGQLAAAIGAGPAPLLVVDGLEHLEGAGAAVEGLLLAVPALTVLATCRRPLGLRAERRLVVDALPCGPDVPDGAVRLLLDRIRRSAAVDETDEPVVAEIAALCGGLPLALELAAARVRLLPLRALRDRLITSTGVLGGADAGSAVDRAVSSSVALLSPGAREVWAAASVFAGAFPPDRVALVRGADLGSTLDRCEELLDLGLLRRSAEEDEVRLELPSVVRDAAAALLDDPARERLRTAHAAVLEALAADSGPGAFDRAVRDRADLRAAMRHRRADRDAAGLHRMLVGLAGVWCAIGEGAELVSWIDEQLDGGSPDRAARAALILARVRAGGQDGGPETGVLLDDAEALLPGATAEVLALRAVHALVAGRPEDAHGLLARLEHAPGGAGPAALLRARLALRDPGAPLPAIDRLPAALGAAAADPGELDVLLDVVDARIGRGEVDAAARQCLGALAATHAEDRSARGRLLVALAAARLLDGRIELARDSERGALRLLAATTWTRQKLGLVLVSAAQLQWRGGRMVDAAFLLGLWTAGLAALDAAPTAAETMLLDRYLRRTAASASGTAARLQGERRVPAVGVHAALEAVVQALLDERAVRLEEGAVLQRTPIRG